jgi:hypothetical protein
MRKSDFLVHIGFYRIFLPSGFAGFFDQISSINPAGGHQRDKNRLRVANLTLTSGRFLPYPK